MRQRLLFIAALTTLAAGCSHAEKKGDTAAPPAKAQSSSTVTEKTKTESTTAATKKSDSTATTGAAKYECAHKGDARTLEVRAKDKGCELGYTKAGKESVVASSGHGMAYCEKAMDKLRDKLSAAGYECK